MQNPKQNPRIAFPVKVAKVVENLPHVLVHETLQEVFRANTALEPGNMVAVG